MRCICGDHIRAAECGEGWCHDCYWVHYNIHTASQGVYCYCKCHRMEVEHADHCSRWEAKGE